LCTGGIGQSRERAVVSEDEADLASLANLNSVRDENHFVFGFPHYDEIDLRWLFWITGLSRRERDLIVRVAGPASISETSGAERYQNRRCSDGKM
jgi:hypothetical protein